MTSRFQKLMKQLLRELSSKYTFVRPLESALPPFLPKASSFYLGQSPKYGKHVFVNLQHSSKPGKAGTFTINVVLSVEYGAARLRHLSRAQFNEFEEGYYRLGTSTGAKDVWWCLLPREGGKIWESSSFREYWVPPDFDDDETVRAECAASVQRFLEERLFAKGGFTATAP